MVDRFQRRAVHLGIDFMVRLSPFPGERMRWTYGTEAGSSGSDLSALGIEAAFEAGADAAKAAIGDMRNGGSAARADAKRLGNASHGEKYVTALNKLKIAIADWALDSSDENFARLREAKVAVDAQSRIFFRNVVR